MRAEIGNGKRFASSVVLGTLSFQNLSNFDSHSMKLHLPLELASCTLLQKRVSVPRTMTRRTGKHLHGSPSESEPLFDPLVQPHAIRWQPSDRLVESFCLRSGGRI